MRSSISSAMDRAALVEQRRPEVELHRIDEPVAVALEHRAVEAELGPDLGDPLGGGVGAAGEVVAASPGTSSVSMNTTNETISRIGMRLTSRRTIRASMRRQDSRISPPDAALQRRFAHASDRRGRRRQNDAGPTNRSRHARGAHMPGEVDLDELAARATAAAQSWAPGCVIDDVQPLTGGASSLTFTGRVDGRTRRGRAHRAQGRAARPRAGPQPRRRPSGPAHARPRRCAGRAGAVDLLRGRRRSARGVAVPRHEHGARASASSPSCQPPPPDVMPLVPDRARSPPPRCWPRCTRSTPKRSGSAARSETTLDDEIKRWTRAFETVDEQMNTRLPRSRGAAVRDDAARRSATRSATATTASATCSATAPRSRR